jgi:uncharacterized membrane protein YhaH (DUF805 family)
MSQAGFLSRMIAPFSRIFDFGGRTRRADFWPYILLLLAIYLVAFIGLFVMGWRAGMGSPMPYLFGLVLVLVLLASAVTVRRLHDVGWSGWWMAIYVVLTSMFVGLFFHAWLQILAGGEFVLIRMMPVVMPISLVQNALGILIFLICVMDGTTGPNRFGPDPKGRSAIG